MCRIYWYRYRGTPPLFPAPPLGGIIKNMAIDRCHNPKPCQSLIAPASHQAGTIIAIYSSMIVRQPRIIGIIRTSSVKITNSCHKTAI